MEGQGISVHLHLDQGVEQGGEVSSVNLEEQIGYSAKFPWVAFYIFLTTLKVCM